MTQIGGMLQQIQNFDRLALQFFLLLSSATQFLAKEAGNIWGYPLLMAKLQHYSHSTGDGALPMYIW